MSGRDEIFDSSFVFLKERMDMILVQEPGALRLRRNEVEEEASADPGIKWNPIRNQDTSVHWSKEYIRWVRSTKRE